MPKVSIAGASGYAGGELIRLIHAHPHFELRSIAAGSFAGSRLRDVHPQFSSVSELADVVFADTSMENLSDADLVFLALPHGQSAQIAQQLPSHVKVVDLGADFRLTDAGQWEKYYDGSYAGSWVYGLPELSGRRSQIAESTHIANPGCYATAIQDGLAPLIAAGLIDASDVVIVAASGTSGAGRRAAANLLASEIAGSMSTYKVGGVHQHTAEVEQELQKLSADKIAVNFTPMLAPMSRGILATMSVKSSATHDELHSALSKAYSDELFVTVLPVDQLPNTASTLGSNAVHVQVAKDEHTGRATIITALDNLIKGASGQAIQNANIMFGYAEADGLSAIGVAP
jgi:N-acetyl-gamma-glutamyl-phosphate reductase